MNSGSWVSSSLSPVVSWVVVVVVVFALVGGGAGVAVGGGRFGGMVTMGADPWRVGWDFCIASIFVWSWAFVSRSWRHSALLCWSSPDTFAQVVFHLSASTVRCWIWA